MSIRTIISRRAFSHIYTYAAICRLGPLGLEGSSRTLWEFPSLSANNAWGCFSNYTLDWVEPSLVKEPFSLAFQYYKASQLPTLEHISCLFGMILTNPPKILDSRLDHCDSQVHASSQDAIMIHFGLAELLPAFSFSLLHNLQLGLARHAGVSTRCTACIPA